MTSIPDNNPAEPDAVSARHRRDPNTPLAPSIPAYRPTSVVVTESGGDVAARMVELWELLDTREPNDLDLPEATLVSEVCDDYDALTAEIEAGRRIPAGA